MDPLLLVTVISSVVSLFFAFHSYYLRAFHRTGLSGVMENGDACGWRKGLETHYTELCLSISLLRTLSNVCVIVSMVCFFCKDGVAWPGALKASGVSLGVLAIIGISIPFACAEGIGRKRIPATFVLILLLRYPCYPVVRIMLILDIVFRRLLGWEESEEDNVGARDEIVHAAEDGQAEGAVNASELKMIESIIELNRVDTAEIMTPRTDVFALEVDTDFSEVISSIRSAGHSRVPVFSENMDNITGVVYAKDLLGVSPEEGSRTLASLLREPFFVPETKSIESLLREFKARQIHMAIVLDEYGGTAGIVTIEDVLEEIVGEIVDEYDKTELPMMRRIDSNTVEVDGRLRIDETNDLVDIELPLEEDYDTVAGYAIAWFGYIPKEGESFASLGAKFTVLKADERRIQLLRITRSEDGESS